MFYTLNGLSRWPVLIPFMVVILSCYAYLDLWLAEIINQHPHWFSSPILHVVTILGLWPVMLTLFFLGYIVCRITKVNQIIRAAVFQVFLTLAISNLIVTVTKILLGRARPILWFKDHLYGFYGPTLQSNFWSFPSGHTATIMAVMWSFSILNTRYSAIWIFLGLLVITSRILLLQHYLSDVLTSTYLALLVAVGVNQYRNRWEVWI